MDKKADVVIAGTGVGGLYSALNLPRDKKIILITKLDARSSDSFLAQGGICMLHDADDYDSYFEDTMRAGHYENRKESVDIMIRSSRSIIWDLIGYGVRFQRKDPEEEAKLRQKQARAEAAAGAAAPNKADEADPAKAARAELLKKMNIGGIDDAEETAAEETAAEETAAEETAAEETAAEETAAEEPAGYSSKIEELEDIYAFTREGAHSRPRILFHEDITGDEITSKLLMQVQRLDNVELLEYTVMKDIIEEDGICRGLLVCGPDGEEYRIYAEDTILATGGIGGRYRHSTNFPHLTGDALDIAEKHGIRLEHLDYVQIHPTTLYSDKPGRRFLISESVRGEGAHLLDKNGNRFTDELQPRDVVTKAIRAQMEKDGTDHVWLDMTCLDADELKQHFPNICAHCLEEGYDVTKEPIPVVPAQHYFMGGIWVDADCSRTSMEHLYAVGETSCNGVHGKNRLASNSLLESLVFAQRAAWSITQTQAEARGELPAQEAS